MGFPPRSSSSSAKPASSGTSTFLPPWPEAMEFSRGETVEWFVEDKGLLALRRTTVPPAVLKKTLPASSLTLSNSGSNASPASTNGASPRAPKPSRGAPCSASDAIP